MDQTNKTDLWAGFSLRESLVVGFCATFIVVSGLFLHLPMHLPAHKVLPLTFFLLLGRACVRPAWSATVIGLIAGVVTISLGGRGAPVHIVQYLMAGGIADVVSILLPAVTRSVPIAALAGGLVGAGWLPVSLLTDRMAGMDFDLAVRHAIFKVSTTVLFGAVGGAFVPTVVRRLQASGLVASRPGAQASHD